VVQYSTAHQVSGKEKILPDLPSVNSLLSINKYVIVLSMNYTIVYYNESVKADIEALPLTLRVRYAVLTGRMIDVGANLGSPHTEALGGGLFELRLKGAEGIARVFYCTLIGK
jgi:hypothetical protein